MKRLSLKLACITGSQPKNDFSSVVQQSGISSPLQSQSVCTSNLLYVFLTDSSVK